MQRASREPARGGEEGEKEKRRGIDGRIGRRRQTIEREKIERGREGEREKEANRVI